MPGDSARVLTDAPVAASSRSLSTARSVLRVFALLLEHPAGVRADEVAKALGKSVSTAYYLLTSLCEEGFAVHESKGVYRRARGLESSTAAVGEHAHPNHALHDGLAGTVDELFLLTRKRSYLGVVKAGRIEIVAFYGRQGVPRMPGLGSEIRDSAHALAMGKVVLSLLSPNAAGSVLARGLNAFTPQTITRPTTWPASSSGCAATATRWTARSSTRTSAASRRPIFDTRGRFVAALGASTTASVFDADREDLRRSSSKLPAARRAVPPPRRRPSAPRGTGAWPRSRELASRCEKPPVLGSRRGPA